MMGRQGHSCCDSSAIRVTTPESPLTLGASLQHGSDSLGGEVEYSGIESAGTCSEIQFLFHPRSVAHVGASERVLPGRFNFTQFLLLMKYQGALYPVNPK